MSAKRTFLWERSGSPMRLLAQMLPLAAALATCGASTLTAPRAPSVRMMTLAGPAATPTGEPPTPEGVVCARGVCVMAEEDAPELCVLNEDTNAISCIENPAAREEKQLWPSALLLGCSVLYGTNFGLGRLMNEALPPAATTSARMLLAAAALSPFLLQLKPSLRKQAALCGTFTAIGYISQSIALDDTPAATVAFLGATTVIVCPLLSATFGGRKLGPTDAPQTWIAAVLTLLGVGLLEMGDGGGLAVGWGDAWSVLQAVGFGTSFYLTERMMAREPTQAMPITAMQCAMSALFAGIWAVADGGLFASDGTGWLVSEATRATHTLPGLLLDESMRPVALAALWTGLITTAANRVGETNALGKLSSSEAAVLLATEPFWAALFAALLLGEALGGADVAGGALIVGACLVNAQDAATIRGFLGMEQPDAPGDAVLSTADGAASLTGESEASVPVSVVVAEAVAATRAKEQESDP